MPKMFQQSASSSSGRNESQNPSAQARDRLQSRLKKDDIIEAADSRSPSESESIDACETLSQQYFRKLRSNELLYEHCNVVSFLT